METPQDDQPSTNDAEFPDGSNAGGDRVEYHRAVAEALPNEESFTVLVVAGATREEVAQMLQVDLTKQVDVEDGWEEVDVTGWALIDIAGGVLAVEPTGYGDPARGTLRELSADGRAAAVLRSNIQAHDRFGAARDGELLFDDDEYTFIQDPTRVPSELRSLFDLAWDGPAGASDSVDISSDVADPIPVAFAMAEVVTGLTLTPADVATVSEAQYFLGPSLAYAASLEE